VSTWFCLWFHLSWYSFGIWFLLGMDTGTIYPECNGFNSFKIAKCQVCDCDSGWRWLSNVGKKYKWWTQNEFSIDFFNFTSWRRERHNVLKCYSFESHSFLWANVTYKFNAFLDRGCRCTRKECGEFLRTLVQRERW
jgi:hypothetical protein